MQRLIDDLKVATANFIEAFAISSVLIVLVFWFIGQPLEITGESMTPTFEDGEHIIANKLSYKFKEPEKGEVVIVKHPDESGVFIIKRIIAAPGDTFLITEGSVYVNGDLLEEPYLANYTVTEGKNAINDGSEITLGDNEYILLGDNRSNSYDSRNWGILNKEDIVGMGTLIYYPITNFRLVQQR